MLFISWNSWGQRYGSTCECVCVLQVWWPKFDSQNPWDGRINSLMLSSDLCTYMSWYVQGTLTFLAFFQHLTEPFHSWSLFCACWNHPVKHFVFAAKILFFIIILSYILSQHRSFPCFSFPQSLCLPPHLSLDLPSLCLPPERAGFPGTSAKHGIICDYKTRHIL